MGFMFPLIKTYKESFEKRTILLSQITAILNFLWSVCKFILGIVFESYFLCMIACFTFLVGLIISRCIKGLKNEAGNDNGQKLYLQGGIQMMILGTIYFFYMLRLFIYPTNFHYPIIPAVTIASFAFTNLVLSIIGIRKIRGKKLLFKEIKLLALATALTDLALTQIAILSFTTSIDLSFYNGMFGLGIAILIMLIGLYIIQDGKTK